MPLPVVRIARSLQRRALAWSAVGCLCALGSLQGCGGGADKPEVPPAGPAAPSAPAPAAPAAEPAAEPAKAKAEPTDHIEDASFELKASPAGSYKSGELASFQVSLVPRGEYHINQDYPISIALKAPGDVNLPKTELARADAAEFGEKVARFDVPFSAKAAGTHAVECDVKFAVCTPETCVPDERTLTLALAVQ